MRHFMHLLRREFLAIAASSAAGTLIAQDKDPVDPKFVSLKDAHIGTQEIDLRIMNQFGDQPRDVQDFYVAIRKAMTGQNPAGDVGVVCQTFNRKKLGGPMLGDLTSTGVSIWMHLPEPASAQIVVTSKGGGESKTFPLDDTAAIQSVRCDGLSPDTSYSYYITVGNKALLGQGSFTTAPAELSEKPFRIAFGADFHKIGLYRPELMKLVRQRGSRAMLLIGDSAVDGRKDDYKMIGVDYMLRNLSPPWQSLSANVPVSATWDDHDYWGNDISGRFAKKNRPIDVEGLRKTWKTYWNNPQRETERAGIYFQTKIGPVHYIALDTRSCRTKKRRRKLNSFLGEEQMKWLKQQIEESTSRVILISGGTMWSDYISNGKDSWGTWDTEGREEIFQAIDKKKDALVLLMSGDRHGARAFAIPRPNGGKIHELEVGTLGGVPGPDAFGENRDDQLFGYPGRSWAFGELTFSLTGDNLQTVFRLINENGKELETISIRR